MKTSDYFAKRSELRMKKAHDKVDPVMERVNKAFDDSRDRLKGEIAKLSEKFEGADAYEVRRLLEEPITYERYQELLQIFHSTKDKQVRAQVKEMLKANAARGRIKRKEAMIEAIERERLAMTGTQLDQFGDHLKKTYKSTLTELGFEGVSKDLVDEALSHKWMGSNYSKRVWKNQEELARQLETNLMEAFISGKSNKQIADEIEYLTDVGRHAANRLVRTETSYMVNSADLESSKQRGIKAKKFEANLDSRTSKICREHNQKIIPIDKIQIGKNAPPMHPYCRSFLADVLEGWDYETEEELNQLIANSEKENKKSLEKYSGEITAGSINKSRKPNTDVEQYLRYKNTIKSDKFNLTFEEFDKIKYNNGVEYEKIKLEYRDEKLRERIRKEYNLNVHEGRQGKHIKGHNNYKDSSYLLDGVGAQELVNKYTGSGELKRDKRGKWTKKEFITADDYIGFYVDAKTGEKSLTKRFSISYSKEQGTHVVPRKEIINE